MLTRKIVRSLFDEKDLAEITDEEHFPGEDAIGLAVGQVINDHKMKKHFNTIRFESSASEFHQLTESTPLQRRVLDLLSTHASPEFAFSFHGSLTTLH